MPSACPTPILPPSLVVVTGANGFIAQHCIALLLSCNYTIVGTVRSQTKADQVLALHSHNPNLSTVVVEDITSPEAYLSALRPLQPTAVLHLAAPFHYNTTNYERDLMIPAVKGSTAILDAAKELGTVRRVVHTNSFAGIYDAAKGPQPGKTYTSADWSPLTYEDGVSAPSAAVAYRASKTVAERAAWEWMEKHPSAGFDLVGLNPAMVFGAFLPGAIPSEPSHVNTSNQIVYGIVTAGQEKEVPPTRGPAWVSVKDVAVAHLRALEVPEAGGGRYLLTAGVYCNQEIADVAREVTPKHAGSIPRGVPGHRETDTHFGVDAKSTEQALGIKWQSMEEMLSGLLPQLFDIQQRHEMI
jgi:nucleoside-diphosphate-sugar epimerase